VQVLPYSDLRVAVEAASIPLLRELQALMHVCCVSHCRLVQAAFVRCLPRLLSCSADMGWILKPVVFDLNELIDSNKNTILQARPPLCLSPSFRAATASGCAFLQFMGAWMCITWILYPNLRPPLPLPLI
jgi:ABC-type polysaccharide/polyol phosphate export permease